MGNKSVIVIGGGLAGLSAAAELTAQGFRVTVLEKGTKAGGKLTAWRDADGESVEHGMHGWWYQYFNFFDLMKRAGVSDEALLKPIPSAVVFEDGDRQQEPPLKRRYPTPLFLFKLVGSVRKLGLVDLLSGTAAFSKMFAFDHAEDYERYDSISAYGYADKWGVSRPLHDLTLSPFARSFAFDSSEEISAASVMSALSFYMFGHQEDVTVRWCRGNPQELILDPLVHFIEHGGGEVRTGVKVLALETDAAGATRIAAVRLEGAGTGNELRVPLSEIPQGAPLVQDVPGLGAPLLLYREAGGTVLARSAKCTHHGCPVAWVAAESLYECPCHGGRFSVQGDVLRGPPARPLDAFETRIDGSEVVVSLGAGDAENRLTADHFVLATEVAGTKEILRASDALLKDESVRRILNLETTEVLVARLWVDKKLPENLSSGVFAGLGFLDNFFVLSNFNDEFRGYDGAVLEVQMYVVKDYIDLPPDEILRHISAELERRIPELSGFRIRKWHLNKHRDVFTSFGVGAQKNRPSTRSPVSNLFFAGDWVRLEKPWWMMEKAVTSGKLAANAILEAEGKAPLPILEPRPDEPFTKFMKSAKRAWRAVKRGLFAIFRYKPLPPG